MVSAKCQRKLTLLILLLILLTVLHVSVDIRSLRDFLTDYVPSLGNGAYSTDPQLKSKHTTKSTPHQSYNSEPPPYKTDNTPEVKNPDHIPFLKSLFDDETPRNHFNDHSDHGNDHGNYGIDEHDLPKNNPFLSESEKNKIKSKQALFSKQPNDIVPDNSILNSNRAKVPDKSWLLNNPNILLYPVVTEDVLPDYFDTTSPNMTSQFEKYHESTAKIMEERRALVREKCEPKKVYLKRSQNFLYYFPDLNTTWCPTFKAGSTNWKQFFCKIYKPDAYYEYLQVEDDPYCALEELIGFRMRSAGDHATWRNGVAGSVKFLTARHPYERLVSVYNNKFRRCERHMFTDSDMLRILRQYREVKLPLDLKEEYIEAARVECHKPEDERQYDPNNPYMHPIGATFREFIQYIVGNFNNAKFPDFHWVSTTKGCDMCITEYDVIEKFETLERDNYYLLKLLGQEHRYADIAGVRSNPSGNTKQILEDYFATLDEKLLWSLTAIYRDDFDLFGYKPYYRVKRNPYH